MSTATVPTKSTTADRFNAQHVVVIGSGLAGLTAALRLRRGGAAGRGEHAGVGVGLDEDAVGERANVTVVTAGVDERLNEHAYIVPGLGDAGDLAFGSKL